MIRSREAWPRERGVHGHLRLVYASACANARAHRQSCLHALLPFVGKLGRAWDFPRIRDIHLPNPSHSPRWKLSLGVKRGPAALSPRGGFSVPTAANAPPCSLRSSYLGRSRVRGLPPLAAFPTLSRPRRPRGSLAQLVEQETFNLLVDGSNPSRPTIHGATFAKPGAA